MLHGANHALVPSSKYGAPVLISEGYKLVQGIGNETLLRYQGVVFVSSRSQQVSKIKGRRRSLNRKCEKMGIRRNDLEPSCLHTLQSWAQFSSGSLLRSPVCDSLQKRLVKQQSW